MAIIVTSNETIVKTITAPNQTIVKTITVSTPSYTPVYTAPVPALVDGVSDGDILRYDSATGVWLNERYNFDSDFNAALDSSALSGRAINI